eukprot:460436-Prorocentrum_minimum.AAC.1
MGGATFPNCVIELTVKTLLRHLTTDWLIDHAGAYERYDATAPGEGGLGGGSDSDSDDESPDLPAKVFVDHDSRFLTCEGVEIHYKLVRPDGAATSPHPAHQDPSALVLIHGAP